MNRGAGGRGGGRGRGRGGRGRGRGRGGRGRGGAGRGRGGGRGGGASGAAADAKYADGDIVHVKYDSGSGAGDALATDVRSMDSAYVRALFLRDAKVQEHIDALKGVPDLYRAQLKVMIERKVALHFSAATKARILAACLCVESKQTPQNHTKVDYKALRAAAALPAAPGGAGATAAAAASAAKPAGGKSYASALGGKAPAASTAAPAAEGKEAKGKAADGAAEKESDGFVVVTKPSARAMRRERYLKHSADASAKKPAAVGSAGAPAAGSAGAPSGATDAKDSKDAKAAESKDSAAGAKAVAVAKALRPSESLVDLLVSHDDLIGLGEVVAAVRLLDNPRKLRVAKQKLARLDKLKLKNDDGEQAEEAEADTSAATSDAAAGASAAPKGGVPSVKANTLAKLRTEINNLSQEPVAGYTMTGARAKRVRQWIAALPAETLEFYALNYPFTNWKELADIVHARKEDFALDYFLSIAFGGTAPDKSLFAAAQNVTTATLEGVLEAYPRLATCYSYLRKRLATRRDERQAVDDKVKAIGAMGFTPAQSKLALQHAANGGDVQRCVVWLLEQGTALDGKAPAADADGDGDMSTGARRFLARHAPLETVLWWYEEFASTDGVEEIVHARLKRGEKLTAGARSNYGKLMERLLYFREQKISFAPLLLPYAEERLKAIREVHASNTASAVVPAKHDADAKADAKEVKKAEAAASSSSSSSAGAPPGGAVVPTAAAAKKPEADSEAGDAKAAGETSDISVAVLGDASGSMEVAIKCASALGSLLSAALHADLVFFNTEAIAPPVLPRSAAQAVTVVEHVRAEGGTSMAAALWPYYAKRQKMDLFVLVSDEEENTQYQGLFFAELFAKYKAEVNPGAKVVLVSFLRVGVVGLIKQRLTAVGLDATQFRLDAERPDTSKFDALLGLVSLESGYFGEIRRIVEETLCNAYGIPTPVIPLIMGY